MTKYEHTHESVNDGSPAMLVAVLNNGDYLLENEDGFKWRDPASKWAEIK